MSDMTESEIQTWLSTKPARLGDTMQDFYRLLYEVQSHRAAMARLEVFVAELERRQFSDMRSYSFAAELRNHIRGDK